jgi:hypothetical protein
MSIAHQDAASYMYDTIDSQSSFNPVGSGARAMGLSGAFIGIADDATAASWNPGGLIQLIKSEISIVGEFTHWAEKNSFDYEPQNNFNSSVSDQNINYISLVSPTFNFMDRSILFSISYQHLFMFPREADYEDFHKTDTTISHSNKHLLQKGKLYAIGIAGCVQVHPKLSFGMTFNFWNDLLGENGWNQKINTVYSAQSELFESISHISFQNKYSFKGFNANLGLLWDITDSLTMGFVIKTPFTANLKHKIVYSSLTQYKSGITTISKPVPYTLSEKLKMPMSSGIGFAYRFSDELTISADIHRTEWQNCVLENQDGERFSFISSKKVEESNIDPTHQIKFGVEYLFFNKKNRYIVPFRGGIFYDQAPAEGSPDDFLGFSLGTGFSSGPCIFDIACQYRFSSDAGGSKILVDGFSQKLNEYRVYSSFIYHFSN